MTPDDYRAPAIEPQPLPEAQEVRRKAVVQAFADWTLRDRRGAGTKRTVSYLEDRERVGYTRKTIGHWFPRKLCGDESVWHALCFAAVDYYKLYKPTDEIPPFVLRCTETYRLWRSEDKERTRTDAAGPERVLDRLGEISADQRSAQLEVLHDDELVELRDQHQDDLPLVTEIVRCLVASKHREMTTNTVFGRIVDPHHGFVAAEKIIEWADPLIRRITAQAIRGAEIDDDIRRNCVGIIDALTDARRLCSRKAERESEEFALISALRSSDLMITTGFRSDPDVALCIYHNDVTQARMQAGRDAPIEGEVMAIESLLVDLTRVDAQAYATYTHALGEENTGAGIEATSARSTARPENCIHADRLISVVALIAVHLVIHPEGSPLRTRVEKCAELVLRLHGNAGRHRRDAKNLFSAARRPSARLADPVTALHIVKFSGIGEMLFARILVEIVTDDFLAEHLDDDGLDFVELYTGGVDEPDEGRGTLALQRAVGLYDRAITWLGERGAYGRLRELARLERDDAAAALKARPRAAGEHNNMEDVHKRIKAFQATLAATIVDGILRADLNSWADIQTSQARTSTVKLLATLNESLRYLKKPELGLRTDVPRGRYEPRLGSDGPLPDLVAEA